jgi:hypothetical protein
VLLGVAIIFQMLSVSMICSVARGFWSAVCEQAPLGILPRLSSIVSHIEPIRDNLAGTDVYGTYVANDRADATFSVPFSALLTPTSDVLLMTGDRAQFVVTTPASILPFQSNPFLTTSFASGIVFIFGTHLSRL